MKIELPKYHWLISRHEGRLVTSTYSGSLGTLGDSGCIGTRTFNYRAFADISGDNESDFRIVAESYIIQPWHLGCNKTDFERKEFEPSENGVAQAAEWLSEISTKHGF
jgi:hypothetical protein